MFKFWNHFSFNFIVSLGTKSWLEIAVSFTSKVELMSPKQFFTLGLPLKNGTEGNSEIVFHAVYLVVDIDQSAALWSPILTSSAIIWQDLNSNFDNTVNRCDKNKFIIDFHPSYFFSLPAPICKQYVVYTWILICLLQAHNLSFSTQKILYEFPKLDSRLYGNLNYIQNMM